MTRTRTDVHRPSTLVTEDYEFFGCGYYGTQGEPGFSPLNTPHGQALLAEGWHFGGESGGNCDHCGAHLRYYAIMKHLPSHTLIRVGETCLDNRFSRTSTEFHKIRKQAELDRKAQKIKARQAEWFAEDETRREAFEWAGVKVTEGDYGYEGMRHNFVHKINRYGDTSDKFVAAILRDKARTEEREAKRAAEQADAKPVVEGKITVTGEVVSAKWQDNDYGSRKVMTVKDDRGFRVWGTVPSAILEVERGNRITFSATVTASEKDETFGFFKRPTKADYIDQD